METCKVAGTASLYRDGYGSILVLNPQRGFVPASPTTSRATRFELANRLAIRYARETFVFEGRTWNTRIALGYGLPRFRKGGAR